MALHQPLHQATRMGGMIWGPGINGWEFIAGAPRPSSSASGGASRCSYAIGALHLERLHLDAIGCLTQLSNSNSCCALGFVRLGTVQSISGTGVPGEAPRMSCVMTCAFGNRRAQETLSYISQRVNSMLGHATTSSEWQAGHLLCL